jgi:hypothetical protein
MIIFATGCNPLQIHKLLINLRSYLAIEGALSGNVQATLLVVYWEEAIGSLARRPWVETVSPSSHIDFVPYFLLFNSLFAGSQRTQTEAF